MKKLFEINIDKYITDWLLDKLYFFKYVHPNIITLTGLIFNFVFLYSIITTNNVILFFSLFFRYLTDCLDGGVARRYSKVSDIGGALDTTVDHIFLFILITAIMKKYNFYNLLLPISLVIINLIFLNIKNSLIHHKNLEKKTDNFFTKFYCFCINNTVFIYIFIIIYLIFL